MTKLSPFDDIIRSAPQLTPEREALQRIARHAAEYRHIKTLIGRPAYLHGVAEAKLTLIEGIVREAQP